MLRPPKLACLFSLAFLSGCVVGPDYVRPDVTVPTAYREAAGWKVAEPADSGPPQAWWQIYGDPTLDQLVAQVDVSNQDIRAAEARYRQAQALLSGARADWYPIADTALAGTRQSTGSNSKNNSGSAVRNTVRLSLASSWEADVWGRISRNVEAHADAAEASAADLAAARLSVQAALAESYLQLRINDAHQRLLARSIEVYGRSLEVTQNRRDAGVASQADVAQAEAQYKSTQAQAVDLGIQRARLEHGIALLLGRTPADFQLPPVDGIPRLPDIPLRLPSTLLESRPDVAAAERRVAAANAQIGVAQAAFFPSLTLSASGSYQDTGFANLISAPNRIWALGPILALTLFDGGARSAQKAQAVAAFDGSTAVYRQTVLAAFQEVEDSLASVRILAQERDVQAGAVRAADEFQTLTTNQYLAGTVSYLNVAIAQAVALNAQQTQLDILDRQLAASVTLVKALGGGSWREAPPALARAE